MADQPEIVLRQHFKVNASGTEEEIIRKISELTGYPIERIKINFEAEKERIRKEQLAYQKLINPFKRFLDTHKSSKDKYEELEDIGRFICSTNLQIELIVPSEPLVYPDFIIDFEGSKIGVEHSRLINQQMRGVTKTAQKLLQDTAKYIEQLSPGISGIINVSLDFGAPILNNKSLITRGFTVAERKQLPVILGDYIYATISGTTISKPECIKKLDIAPNPGYPLSIDLSEHFFVAGGLKKLALDRIEAKEEKLNNYKSKSQLNRIWLLLVVDGLSSHSRFDLQNELFLYDKVSGFELIIVFEVFSGKYFIIFDRNRTITE